MLNQISFLPRAIESNDWIVFFLLFLLGILAWVKKRYPRRTQRLVKSFVSVSFVKKLKKEEYFVSHVSTIVFSFVFVSICSLFLWKLVSADPGTLKWITNLIPFKKFTYLAIFVLVSIVFLLKIFLIKFINFFLRGNEFLEEYLGNYLVISFFVGILLFLPVMGYIFSNTLIKDVSFWMAILVLAFFVVYLVVRGIFVAINHKVSIFYIILYFCTLEILPVLLMVKSISS